MNHSIPIRLLIVEDDEEDFLITKKLISAIKGMNITVERGNSFNAAFELIDKEDYDFYLIDYRLGAQSG